jgi:DNA-directed RNA polymerase I subunit RPA1
MDEGIADMDVEEEEEVDDIELSDPEGEDLTASASLVLAEAGTGNAKGPKAKEEAKQAYIPADEVHAMLTLLFERESELIQLLYNPRSGSRKMVPLVADMFFVDTLLVSPSKYRPEARTGDGAIAEAGRNTHYRNILTKCDNLAQISRQMQGMIESSRIADIQALQEAQVQLQHGVNSLFDRDKNPVSGGAAKRNEEGIKQVLEKKEGLFRMNMMGKRVNFAARSVISPDPNIETNEIGVPPVFAKRLTYPEPVTSHNFYELKEAVLNGPDKWPGAVAVENENGQVIALAKKNMEERMAIANQLLTPSNSHVDGSRNKKVHRHLNNGDIVIMNRQPTLHKPSMMCHRARVLPGERTIRMHYANCNTYNADFDGDEMNMHFPQNEIARAEAMTIANTDNQYLSSTAGKPLRGLIQDHISMGVQLTNRDVFYNREEYQQLIYAAIRPESNHTTSERLIMLPPAIMKPAPLWTGKQVISTVLKNIQPRELQPINLTGRSQTSKDFWGPGSEEQEVIFKDGELLCGIMDKAQIGPASGSIVNAVYEAYGEIAAGKLLSILGRLLTKVLHMRAHSCGVQDLILTQQGDDARKNLLKNADSIGLAVASEYVTMKERKPTADDPELRIRLERVLRDDSKQAVLDELMKKSNNKLSGDITIACLPHTLIKLFPKNQMQAMTGTGAKGSSVNANQISCNLGQQVLEGRRVPIMVSGKSLPSFRPFDPSIRAGGYIMGRFLTGLKPQEYFFHMMSGREGLIDTAVKTSRSGYLQRCLIKGMEGLKVEYDTSVRDSDGSMVQFLYGEDGLDVGKQQYLTNFTFMSQNFMTMIGTLGLKDEHARLQSQEAREVQKKIARYVKKGKAVNIDPVMSVLSPSRHLGSTSEKFYHKATTYMDLNKDGTIKDKKKDKDKDKDKSRSAGKVSKKAFELLTQMKYLKTLAEPGEAVGVVAGQSIGEPSTQMTLNTFHLAGHSSKNVTLGIPRLREILMTASAKISTPGMTLYPLPEMSLQGTEKFAKSITRLSLADLIDEVEVRETVGRGTAYLQAKTYKIRLVFFPSEAYCNEYAIETDDVFMAVAKRFLPALQAAIRKELRKKGEKISASRPDVGASAGRSENITPRAPANQDDEGAPDDTDEDSEDEGEGDATANKSKANRTEGAGYEDPDEDDQRIRDQIRGEDELEDEILQDDMQAEKPEDDAPGLRRDYDSDAESQDSGYVEGSDVEDRRQSQKRSRQEQESFVKGIKGNEDIASFRFSTMNSYASISLEYSASSSKLLMLHLVEKFLHATVVHAVPGLTRCLLNRENKTTDPLTGDKKDEPTIETEGINIEAMRDCQHAIDPHRIVTNDIFAMLRLYGVEAARATIVRELDAVFSGHGISVDNRHLNLISDFMTRAGGFRPFNRLGMRNNASPFMKMSFETTVGFLREAVLEGEMEDARNPSAKIVLGRMGTVGTGGFGVYLPVEGEGDRFAVDEEESDEGFATRSSKEGSVDSFDKEVYGMDES